MRKLSTLWSTGVPISISVGGLLAVSLLAKSLQNGAIPLWVISTNKLLNFTYTMQLMVLPISFVAMALIYFYNKKNFKTFLRLKIDSTNTSAEKNNWKLLGPIVAVAFTLGTVSYMSIGVISFAIHFLQDIVIFGAGAMILAGQH
jgi:hypothetical protein